MAVVLRESCNACYKLKTKCISAGSGACENCRQKGRPCQFSPRNEMGRPRRHACKYSSAKRQPVKRASTVTDPEPLKNANRPSPPLRVSGECTAREDVIDLPWKSLNLSESASNMVTHSLLSWGDEPDQNLMTEASDLSCYPWARLTPPPFYSPTLDSGAFAEDFDLSDFHSLLADPIVSASPPNKTNVDSWKPVEQGQRAESLTLAIPATEVSISESTSAVDTYPQLAYMLFVLRTTQENKHDGEPSTLRNKTFAAVSSLCDMIKIAQLCSPANWGGETLSPRLMLVASIISVVVEVYSRYVNEFAPPSRYKISTLDTHRCLQLHADAIIMDFHLRQLRQVFRGTGLAVHDVRTTQMIDQMRATLTVFFDDWRYMMDNSE